MVKSEVGELLTALGGAIEEEFGLECRRMEGLPGIPTPSLAVVLEPDGQGRTRLANLMPLPLEGSGVEEVHLLQMHFQLPVTLREDRAGEVESFMASANALLPIGALGVNQDREIILKYVCPIYPSRQVPPQGFLEVFVLWMFILDRLSPLVESVNDGSSDALTALGHLR